ncbi:MAG: hypothetical protein JWR68_2264 [Polaromonas sp.]|nr:hypothetical protein [Polaromonas sp.]
MPDAQGPEKSPAPARAAGMPGIALPAKLPVRQLLLVLGLVATAYAVALLVWGDSPRASLARLWSLTGLQAAGLCLLSYALRGLRWRLWMAHQGRHFGLWQGLRLYLAGYAFTPTPGNIGEAIRGLMLARQPLSAWQGLAIFGAERLADLMCLLLLCLPAVWWAWEHGMVQQMPAWLGWLALAGLGMAVLALGLLFRLRPAWLHRLGWLRHAWACLRLQPLVWFALTLAAWAAQGVAVWLICHDSGVSLDLLSATGFYAVAMVAGALSALPAGLGGTEAVLTGLLVAHGAAAGNALAITVLTRLLTLWLAVAIGLAALIYSAAIAKEVSFR